MRVRIGCVLLLMTGVAQGGPFDLWGVDGTYQLQAGYSIATRLEDPHPGIIASSPSPRIPLPDYLKLPESSNYDDGDRNFRAGAIVNNRLSLLGELMFTYEDYGVQIRGDAFYDHAYRRRNDNDSPDTINKSALPVDRFSDAARFYDGRRARLLDAYAFGSWYIGDEAALNLRAGRHIAAWGESLFFAGIALAMSPADATKATVPDADVKSILLPINRVSMQFALNNEWTLLGDYKLEFKEVELNPVGEFFSVTDVVGPGAEFIYGIRNPLYPDTLAQANLTSDDALQTLALVSRLLGQQGLPTASLTDILASLHVPAGLPPVHLPASSLAVPGTPKNINVQRGPDIRPSDHGQYGIGLTWQATPGLNLGLYRLRYHNTTPAPVQTYGDAVLVPGTALLPAVTTGTLGLKVPVTYNVRYFDGIDLTGASFSTTLFGLNVAGEALYRDGVDVLVDVDGGLLGPVPTPTRARVMQGLVSAIYTTGPALFWDSFTLVGETGYVHVHDVDPAAGPDGRTFRQLTYTRDAWGYSFLALIDRKNVLAGWDLQLPLTAAGVGRGHSSLLSGLGSLMGEGDYRASLGASFTWLQKLSVGASWNAFLGRPDFKDRPYADRDYAAFTTKYIF